MAPDATVISFKDKLHNYISYTGDYKAERGDASHVQGVEETASTLGVLSLPISFQNSVLS